MTYNGIRTKNKNAAQMSEPLQNPAETGIKNVCSHDVTLAIIFICYPRPMSQTPESVIIAYPSICSVLVKQMSKLAVHLGIVEYIIKRNE